MNALSLVVLTIPFWIPAAAGLWLCINRRNDLGRLGGLLTLKPLLATPISLFILATALHPQTRFVLSLLPGASLLLGRADAMLYYPVLAASGRVQTAQPNYIYRAPEAQGMKGQAYQQPDYVAQSGSGKSLHLSWDQLNSLRSIKKVGYRSAAVPTFPNELGSGRLWAWDKIQADLIWNEKKVSPLVCVLDTGVDNKHPDLLAKVILGKDFVNNDALPADDNGHGTHVAGLIAAKLNNGATGAAGVSNGSILAVKVLDAQGLGTSYSVTAGIIACTLPSPPDHVALEAPGDGGAPRLREGARDALRRDHRRRGDHRDHPDPHGDRGPEVTPARVACRISPPASLHAQCASVAACRPALLPPASIRPRRRTAHATPSSPACGSRSRSSPRRRSRRSSF